MNIKIRNKISRIRRSEEFNLSQGELANRVGVSRVRISQVENGGTPSAELMLKLSIFFNKDAREIFSLEKV
ncbi:helix-turn-helix domain-containing protein [Brevibacillus laterosporus]|uniref:helix-turn-helix transcriptional regulator n=1 Tax=Brevibacillus laterosporus TaxID=1465 RepID=UPI003D21F99A